MTTEGGGTTDDGQGMMAAAPPGSKRTMPLPEVSPIKKRRALMKSGLSIVQTATQSTTRWYTEISKPNSSETTKPAAVTHPQGVLSYFVPPPQPLYYTIPPLPMRMPCESPTALIQRPQCNCQEGKSKGVPAALFDQSSFIYPGPYAHASHYPASFDQAYSLFESQNVEKNGPPGEASSIPVVVGAPDDVDSDAESDCNDPQETDHAQAAGREATDETPESQHLYAHADDAGESSTQKNIEIAPTQAFIEESVIEESVSTAEGSAETLQEVYIEISEDEEEDSVAYIGRSTFTADERLWLVRYDNSSDFLAALRLDEDESDPWLWSGMLYDLNLYEQRIPPPLPTSISLTPASILFRNISTDRVKFYCLIRRIEIDLGSVLRLLKFYSRQLIFLHLLKYANGSTIKYTINSRMGRGSGNKWRNGGNRSSIGENKKIQCTPYGKSIFVKPCIDCSSFILFHKPCGGYENDQLEGVCSACERIYIPIDQTQELQEISAWQFKPAVWSAEPFIFLFDETLDPQNSLHQDLIRFLEIWAEHGALSLSYLVTLLGIIGPGLNAILRRLPEERLCAKCGLGIISGTSAQLKFQCSWCLASTLSNPKVKQNTSVQNHATYAESVIREINQGVPEETLSEDEPSLEPLRHTPDTKPRVLPAFPTEPKQEGS